MDRKGAAGVTMAMPKRKAVTISNFPRNLGAEPIQTFNDRVPMGSTAAIFAFRCQISQNWVVIFGFYNPFPLRVILKNKPPQLLVKKGEIDIFDVSDSTTPLSFGEETTNHLTRCNFLLSFGFFQRKFL